MCELGPKHIRTNNNINQRMKMVTGIPHSTNIAEVRGLFEKFDKEENNFKKLEIAHKIENFKIPRGAFPEDWDETIPHQKRAMMEKSMLFFVVDNQYLCCYFKKDSIITYDKIGISWNEDDLVDFKILSQTPLR